MKLTLTNTPEPWVIKKSEAGYSLHGGDAYVAREILKKDDAVLLWAAPRLLAGCYIGLAVWEAIPGPVMDTLPKEIQDSLRNLFQLRNILTDVLEAKESLG